MDLEGPEGDDGEQQQQRQTPQQAAAAAAATKGQAKSAAARALLAGDILADVVALHGQLFGALAALQGGSAGAVSGSADSAAQAPAAAAAGTAGGADAAREAAFHLSYQLGVQLVAAQRGLAPAGLDAAAGGGHLLALCNAHSALDRVAASTSSQVAAAPAPGRRAAAAAATAADASGEAVDMQAPAVSEVVLMLEPVRAVAARLEALLEEWPEHPILVQLAGICAHILALPMASPLKAALTGLELLLSRAQVGAGSAYAWVCCP